MAYYHVWYELLQVEHDALADTCRKAQVCVRMLVIGWLLMYCVC